MHPCLSTFSNEEEEELALDTKPEKDIRYTDSEARPYSQIFPATFYSLFRDFEDDAYTCIHYFSFKGEGGGKEKASFDDVLLIVSSNNARIAGIYGKYRPIYLFFCFPPLFVSVNIKSCYRAL